MLFCRASSSTELAGVRAVPETVAASYTRDGVARADDRLRDGWFKVVLANGISSVIAMTTRRLATTYLNILDLLASIGFQSAHAPYCSNGITPIRTDLPLTQVRQIRRRSVEPTDLAPP